MDPPATRRRRAVVMVVTLPATRPSTSSVGKGARRLRPAVAAGTGPAWANAVVVPASLLAITAMLDGPPGRRMPATGSWVVAETPRHAPPAQDDHA